MIHTPFVGTKKETGYTGELYEGKACGEGSIDSYKGTFYNDMKEGLGK